MEQVEQMEVTVGVLALQGAFEEHIDALRKVGFKAKEVIWNCFLAKPWTDFV
jgi:glutamine amidotransferase PdxT